MATMTYTLPIYRLSLPVRPSFAQGDPCLDDYSRLRYPSWWVRTLAFAYAQFYLGFLQHTTSNLAPYTALKTSVRDSAWRLIYLPFWHLLRDSLRSVEIYLAQQRHIHQVTKKTTACINVISCQPLWSWNSTSTEAGCTDVRLSGLTMLLAKPNSQSTFGASALDPINVTSTSRLSR